MVSQKTFHRLKFDSFRLSDIIVVEAIVNRRIRGGNERQRRTRDVRYQSKAGFGGKSKNKHSTSLRLTIHL